MPAPVRRSRETAGTWAVASTSGAAVGSSRIGTSGPNFYECAGDGDARRHHPPDRSEARLMGEGQRYPRRATVEGGGTGYQLARAAGTRHEDAHVREDTPGRPWRNAAPPRRHERYVTSSTRRSPIYARPESTAVPGDNLGEGRRPAPSLLRRRLSEPGGSVAHHVPAALIHRQRRGQRRRKRRHRNRRCQFRVQPPETPRREHPRHSDAEPH